MTKRVLVALAVAVGAVVVTPATATANGPQNGAIDISGAELAGSVAIAAVNVYGTVRCASAGPLNLDVALEQPSTGGIAAGSNNGLTCPAPGELIMWAITAGGTNLVVGEKATITALADGATIAVDTEEHVLRWGR